MEIITFNFGDIIYDFTGASDLQAHLFQDYCSIMIRWTIMLIKKIYEHLESYNNVTKSFIYLRNLFNKDGEKNENERI